MSAALSRSAATMLSAGILAAAHRAAATEAASIDRPSAEGPMYGPGTSSQSGPDPKSRPPRKQTDATPTTAGLQSRRPALAYQAPTTVAVPKNTKVETRPPTSWLPD